MSPVQRVARFSLLVSLATVVAFVALWLWRGFGATPASMVVMALTGFVPFFHRDRKSDERERLLAARGLQFGMTAAYLFVGAVCMGLWFTRYNTDTPVVDVNVLPMIAVGAWVVSTMVNSAAVLIAARQPMEIGA